MMKKRILATIAILTMLISLIACSAPNSQAGAQASPAQNSGNQSAKKKIGVALASLGTEQNTLIKGGVMSVGDKYADKYEFAIADAQMDSSKQLQQIENFVSQKMDAIIVVSVDAEASQAACEIALDANIPVIGCNTEIKDISILTCYVGSDCVESGRIELESLAKAIGGKGKIVELQGTYGHQPQIDRHEGIEQALKNYPEIEVIASDTANWQKDEGLKKMENWLQSSMANDITAVIAHNDQMALGAYVAIEDAGLKDKITVAGIDAATEMLDLIDTGAKAVTIYQDMYGQGVKACEAAIDILEGKNVEKEIWIPYIYVDPAETAKYRMK